MFPLATAVDERTAPSLITMTSPVTDGAWVRLTSGKPAQLSVIDANGRLVRVEQARGNEHWLSTASLAAGLYLLRAEDLTDERSELIRFIKE